MPLGSDGFQGVVAQYIYLNPNSINVGFQAFPLTRNPKPLRITLLGSSVTLFLCLQS